MFHRPARELAPLATRILERVAARELVWADETPHRMQGAKGKKAYVWTFLDDRFITYVFSESHAASMRARPGSRKVPLAAWLSTSITGATE